MFRLEVYHHFPNGGSEDINSKLDAILKMLRESKNREVHMSLEMDALKVEVAGTKAGIDSAIVFIQGISAQIADAAGDKAASLALAAELKSKTAELSAAFVAPGTNPAPPAA